MPGSLLIADSSNQKKLAIFIHGSGPNDRDETFLENKPFKDLAEGLLQYGISSYRFDKRTKVAPLLCLDKDFSIDDEVTNDVLNIIHYFHEDDSFKNYKIYIIGHSLGAMMSPRIALKAGNELSGAVMLAGNARPLDSLLLEQFQYLNSLQESQDVESEIVKLKKQIAYLNSPKFNLQSPSDSLPLLLNAAYWKSLKDYDQLKEFSKTTIPFFILQGEKDYQVCMVDYQLWKNAARGKSNIKLKSYPELTHLFMGSKGEHPSPSDYTEQQHVNKSVIKDISLWIKEN